MLNDGLITVNQAWGLHYWAAGSCAVAPSAWVQIDLGEVTLADAVEAYHRPGWSHCQKKVEVSIDGSSWKPVYDGSSTFLVSGTKMWFAPEKAQFVRYWVGRSNYQNWVALDDIVVYGGALEPAFIDVSNDGGILVMAFEGQAWLTSGKAGDGIWVPMTNGITNRVTDVAVSDKEHRDYPEESLATIYGLYSDACQGLQSAVAYARPSRPAMARWFSQVNQDLCLTQVVVSGDGSLFYDTNEAGHMWYKRASDASWSSRGGRPVDMALNADGTALVVAEAGVGVIWAYNLHQDPAGMANAPYTKFGKSPTGTNFRSVSLGGLHELWAVDDNLDIWHTWIVNPADGSKLSHRGWQQFDGKMMSITASSTGMVYGVSEDGRGVLRCFGRDPVNYDLRCDYVMNPLDRATV
ncbi:expressed unknown protein [Seminavis robusta]|uniref:F5/8 type C domain-containing protein n=1 Tax=Seminavis robusta TaxID=568900 RepID=A0A9N8HBZ7_9STRA|nr:expressed unknown protein [Seminavis robusta]|eukprot:Sro357_g125730.1 n/a (408) ;mRNA; f:58482-60061